MNELLNNALSILRSLKKDEFITTDLVNNGFSPSAAKFVVEQLEESGYILVTSEYVNGSKMFELL